MWGLIKRFYYSPVQFFKVLSSELKLHELASELTWNWNPYC